MELPLDLIPLIVAAADCGTAAVLARVCTVANAATAAKFDALIIGRDVDYDDKIMWMRSKLYVMSHTSGAHSVYYILPGPDIEYIPAESNYNIRIVPPKLLVKKYYAYIQSSHPDRYQSE